MVGACTVFIMSFPFSSILQHGFIRHTVNKITFSEQCYYVFGDFKAAASSLPSGTVLILMLKFIVYIGQCFYMCSWLLEVVCRVGEHEHRLVHRCSLCEQFSHILEV